MSFLQIPDPKKRRETVEKFLKSRKNIEKDFVQEKLGEMDFQQSIQQFTQPIKQIQEQQTQQLSDKLDTLKPVPQIQGITNIPALTAGLNDPTILSVGPLALESLSRVQQGLPYDTIFGIKGSSSGDFYLGDTKIEIVGDDIHLEDGVVYKGTEGLWDLINNPEPEHFNDEDYEEYRRLALRTNLLFKKDGKPKSSRALKWTEILKPIYQHYKSTDKPKRPKEPKEPKEPKNGGSTIILPSDPNALIDRLQLLSASKQAGNTGVQNEIVKICDELLRQGVINKQQYKRFFTQ
jgi:polyhydroxyalkanoate synthesis regulator phasin